MSLAETFATTLAGARVGADWAWTELYRDLAPSVLGYLHARRAPDPDDLLGQVFMHVVRDLHGFSGEGRDFRAWVLTIAHRRLVDELRHRARAVPEVLTEELPQAAGPGGDAEDDALVGLGTLRARTLILRLPPDQQEVLLLRILGDMTIVETATALGKRPGAVKALQRRGLARLKQEISLQAVPL